MAGGDVPVKRRVPLLIVALFLVSLTPSAHAVAGAGVMDVNSFGLTDYETFSSANHSFTLEVHETDGGTAEVDLNVTVTTLEGAILQTLPSQSLTLTSLEQQNVTVFLTSMEYGYSLVHIELSGDIGVETATQSVNLTRTVQRLRPLSVGLGAPGSLLSQGVGSLGTPTGNLSVHDGDFVQLQLPVINQGDVNWSGSVGVYIENGGQNESVLIQGMNVEAMSSSYATATSSFPMVEGTMTWSFSLNGTLGEDQGSHIQNGSLMILPPPLPLLTTSLSSNAGEINAGEDLIFELNVTNSGDVDFTGSIRCSSPSQILLNASSGVPSDTFVIWQFNMTAKPVTVECILQDGRISSSSSLPHELTVEMESASFASAGSTTPSLTGGPWHQGDALRANMLIRNVGDLEGRVRMVLIDQNAVSGTQPSAGEWVVLDSGEAGEVSSSFFFLQPGEHSLQWSLESDDGSLEGVYEGNFTLPVNEQQSIGLDIDKLTWSQESGVGFEISFDLDEGKPRDVLVQLGYETAEATVYLYEYTRTLEQGTHTESFTFGHITAEKIVLKVSSTDWAIGPGALSTTESLSSERTNFWIEMDPVPSPIIPAEGDSATIRLTLRQSGPTSSSVGEVILKDAYDEILATVTSPSWGTSQTSEMEIDLVWPKGSNVVIHAVWSVDGELVTVQESFVSGDSTTEESNSLPWGAVVWGIVAGTVIALALRLRLNREESSSEADASSESPEPLKPTSSRNNQEKVEVQCPKCDRRLRVPSDYSGSVGCPDCSNKFSVQGNIQSQVKEEVADSTPTQSVPEPSKPQATKDGKVEISCPDCAQTLRIPDSYDGSVRCPACTKVFKAKDRK
tara:strand:+ start:32516 stop:35056 length:2541 start_codon:yes stop_codon:yes gene_type:complete